MENKPVDSNNQVSVYQGFMNHKLASVGVALAVLAAATGIAFWQKPVSEVSPQTTRNENVNTLDNTDSWPTYQNTQYQFEIKYPSDWAVSEKEDSSNELTVQFVSPGAASDGFTVFTISFAERDQYFGEKIVLSNGMTAIKMDGKSGGGTSEQNIILDYPIAGHPKSGYVYVFNYQVHKDNLTTSSSPAKFTESEEAVRSRILSTFRFMGSENVTGEWETYSNTEYGIEFLYPQNWLVKESVESNGSTHIVVENTVETYFTEMAGTIAPAIFISIAEDVFNEDIYKYFTNEQMQKIIQKEMTTIGSQPAYIIQGITPPVSHDSRVVFYLGKVYKFGYGGYLYHNDKELKLKQDFNELLSTFKFTK